MMKLETLDLETLKSIYHTLSLADKLSLAKSSTNEAIIEYMFYDMDDDVRLEIAQNEYLPIGKLKRLGRDANEAVREMSIVMYERRLIY